MSNPSPTVNPPEVQSPAVIPTNANPPKWRAFFKSLDQMQQGEPRFLISNFLPEGGATFLAGLSGAGKTWLALSIVKSLVTGQPFVGEFKVPETVPVLYLIPESNEWAFRRRVDKMRIPSNEKMFLCRTMTDGVAPRLNNPDLLEAVKSLRPVVFLDTMARFNEAKDENSNSENRRFSEGIFGLLQSGACAVVILHHAPKSAAGQEMTLENMLRGSGDIGAMAETVYGIKVINEEKFRILVKNLKPRPFEENPPAPFVLQGRPYINEEGDFRYFLDEGGSPKDMKEDEEFLWAVRTFPTASYEKIRQETRIPKNKVAKVADRCGWHKVSGTWVAGSDLRGTLEAMNVARVKQ